MTMHGMFWNFPQSFTAENSAGIRARSAYLKVIGDFTRWNDQLVFGCDDSAQREFLNKRKHKGGIEGPGQSNSNLWFTSLDKPDQLGTKTASGSVWLNDELQAEEVSEPFLFAGWPQRSAWIDNGGPNEATFSFEGDKSGYQNWEILKTVSVSAGSSKNIEFTELETGEWIRVRTDSPTTATVSFNYSGAENRSTSPSAKFQGLSEISDESSLGGLLYGLGNDGRSLGISAVKFENDRESESRYYELDAHLNLVKKADPETNTFIQKKFAIPENVIEMEESSILITDDKNRRWRLPLGSDAYQHPTDAAQLRICREVATERDLFHASGTFYELPAENADGFAKIRPIASHNFRIHDYASYRGLLVMTGMHPDAQSGKHIIRSDDGQAAVWAGAIDDLWELGKPVGHGGPWKESPVQANVPSDAYLIGFYDKKTLTLSHDSPQAIRFKMEVEPVGHGPWMLYKEITVEPGQKYEYVFPDSFQSRWIRFSASQDCRASALLIYE